MQTLPAEAEETPQESAATETAPSVAAIPSMNSLPSMDGFQWQPFAAELSKPVFLTGAGDGSGKVYIVEQAGLIWQLGEDGGAKTQFLDIRGRIRSSGSEQGLLGLAFHPDYPAEAAFFVNYTDGQGDTTISRFTVAEGAQAADPASEKFLLRVDQPYANHNGGDLAFGPDGYLYIALGDGGSAGDPQDNAQNLQSSLGKLLRIDVDQGEPYAIPADNPFSGADGLQEIWAYGLRNPWRFSFDRLSGDMYIADVGQGQWEEVNFLPAGTPGGTNFGWRFLEGSHPYEGTPPADALLVDPIAEYDHSQGCSVTGGYAYRGETLPEWLGVYLYADFCSGNLWAALRLADGTFTSALLEKTPYQVSSFGQDDRGEVYLLDYNGAVYRLAHR